MDTFIVLIGVILLTFFAVYLAWKNSGTSLKCERYSSNEVTGNEKSNSLKYYIATSEGKTEGPFYSETLEVMERRKSINFETLICQEGEHEWIKYGELISSKTQEKTVQPSVEAEKKQGVNYSSDGVSGAFRGVGIVCFVLAVIVPLVLLAGGSGQTIFAAAIFLVLALSGLGWLGVGVIIRLLERIAENTGK